MDIFTHMFTSHTIVENPKKKPPSKPTLHETNIAIIEHPYQPMISPKNIKK